MMEDDVPSVWLRAMELDDLDLLYQVENDTDLWRVGSTNVPYSRQFLRDFILRTTGDIYTDKQVRLIADDQFGTPVAIADIADFDPGDRRAEVGLVVLPLYRGQGFGRATMVRLMDYARTTLHLHQLIVYVGVDNRASRNLFTSLGFSVAGRLKDWVYDGESYHDALVMQVFLEKFC